jgi:hypothetical protein
MDKDAMVIEEVESGLRVISALNADGFDVRIALWVKPAEEGDWFLYLASPIVDEKGPATAYRLVFDTMRKTPDLRIKPLEIRVVGMNDSLAEAALALVKPKVPDSPFANQNPSPYLGPVLFRGGTLGGLSIDGAYIY